MLTSNLATTTGFFILRKDSLHAKCLCHLVASVRSFLCVWPRFSRVESHWPLERRAHLIRKKKKKTLKFLGEPNEHKTLKNVYSNQVH